MQYSHTVYFTDGSSGIVEFEKPPGEHPDSKMSFQECLASAERGGKTVDRICKSYVVNRRIIDLWSVSRDDITCL